MQTYKPLRIAAYSPNGEFQGILSPSFLQFDDRDDADRVCARYNDHFPKVIHRVVRVDSCGYIIDCGMREG